MLGNGKAPYGGESVYPLAGRHANMKVFS